MDQPVESVDAIANVSARVPERSGIQRRPRLEEVAAEVGMSPASVSMVLRGVPGPSVATCERVHEAASRLGYRADRSASLLASRQSTMVGVVLDVRSSFHADLVEQLQGNAERHGLELLIGARSHWHDDRQSAERLIDSRCAALVLLGPESTSRWLRELAVQLPVVVVGRRLAGARLDVVRVDDQRGTANLVDHLVGLGHEDIAYVDGGAGGISAGRRRGYVSAMRRAGLGERVHVVPGGGHEDDGAGAATLLRYEGALPTAVVVFNDHAAVGLMGAFKGLGILVPGDVSVAGYDNSPLSRSSLIDLTTVNQDVDQLAEATMELVADRLSDRARAPRQVVIPPKLVLRSTTAPPARSGVPSRA